MAIEIIENIESREQEIALYGKSRFVAKGHILTDGEDETAVRSALLAWLQPFYFGLILGDVRITPINNNLWSWTAEYIVPNFGDLNVSAPNYDGKPVKATSANRNFLIYGVVSIKTVFLREHVTTAIKNIKRLAFPGLGAPPDHGLAIGVDGEDIKGIDIDFPILEWTERYYASPGNVTIGWAEDVNFACGKVNVEGWRGYPARCVRFSGFQCDFQDNKWQILVSFQYKPPENIVFDLGGGVQFNPGQKAGWDIGWVLFEDQVVNGVLRKRPRAYYEQQVYREFDFSTLGL